VTTYRIEQWTREGQILRAEYVDEDGQAYTLRTALAAVDGIRSTSPWVAKTELRIVDNRTGQPIDEEAERRPWWLKDRGGNVATSTFEIASMLEELAVALRAEGDQPTPDLQVHVALYANHYSSDDAENVRVGQVDLLSKLMGQKAEQKGGSYESEGRSAYAYAYGIRTVADEPEPIDEPTPEPLDADREDPETGEPVPDGVEGHPVGRVVEQTARAILQPDTLPNPAGVESVDEAAAVVAVPGHTETRGWVNEDATRGFECACGTGFDNVAAEDLADVRAAHFSEPVEENRCDCGQPWALIISGNAKHIDGCSETAQAEAGEAEDALGVPGLTAGEADDFMSGGAR